MLNRTDLLPDGSATRVREDLRAELDDAGLREVPVLTTQARRGGSGVEELRRWLTAESDDKTVVAERLAADIREAIGDLARRAAVTDGLAPPLVTAERREAALRDIAGAAIALVDPRGLEAQAVAATRLSARRRGTGPLGVLTSALYRWSGRARASANPATYLRHWRERGSLAPASEPMRALVASALPPLPSTLRPAVAALAEPANIERGLAAAIDRAIDDEARDLRVPASVLWSAIGAGQFVVAALLVFAAIWFASLFVLDHPAVGSVALPLLGPVPSPVLFLAGVLLAGYVLTLLLRLHAGWVARRWVRLLHRPSPRQDCRRSKLVLMAWAEGSDFATGIKMRRRKGNASGKKKRGAPSETLEAEASQVAPVESARSEAPAAAMPDPLHEAAAADTSSAPATAQPPSPEQARQVAEVEIAIGQIVSLLMRSAQATARQRSVRWAIWPVSAFIRPKTFPPARAAC